MSSHYQVNTQSVISLKVMPGYSGGQGGGDTRN